MPTQEKQTKMHTIELTEHELARVLFVMRYVNGKVYGKPFTSLAFEKLGAKEIGIGDLEPKAKELAKTTNIPSCMDYYAIQKEWETFLGVGEEAKNTDILDKIAKMEKELAELKGMLC